MAKPKPRPLAQDEITIQAVLEYTRHALEPFSIGFFDKDGDWHYKPLARRQMKTVENTLARLSNPRNQAQSKPRLHRSAPEWRKLHRLPLYDLDPELPHPFSVGYHLIMEFNGLRVRHVF